MRCRREPRCSPCPPRTAWGVRGLWVVLFCLALGVAVIAAVGSLRAAIDAGLAADGRRLLGGDVEVEGGSRTLPDSLREWLRTRGATLSDVVQMRSILVAPSGERQLIELKAVDAGWPLVGAPVLSPPQRLGDALAERDGRFGLLAERVVLDRLGLKPGDDVRLGTASFRVAGTLASEPDRVATPSLLGPRVLISMAALPRTGLIAPGAMLRYGLRAVTQTPAAGPALAADIRQNFPSQGWRIREPRDAAPGVNRFIDRTALFLTLAGLTSLLVGGIGVANGVRAWLDARARSIAILRCLGASARLVFAVCLIQVMALSCIGIVAGLAIGAAVPNLAGALLGDLLPVPPVQGVYPLPLLLAAGFGVLTALCFALWPLGRAARIPGGALFRDGLLPERTRPSIPLVIGNVAVAAALVGLTVLAATERVFALWFCAAVFGTLVLFHIGALAVMRLARLAPALPVWRRVAPWARLGIANLHRPGTPTPLLLLSVGLGLSTLAAVALIQGNMRREILEQLPTNAPSFFFVDIQNEQLTRFEALVRAQPGFEVAARRAVAACAHRRREGRAGRAGCRHARNRLGAAWRPQPDLCRDATRGHASGRGHMVAGGVRRSTARLL